MGTLPELSAEREVIVEAPPALVWAIAGDTNRWDRVVRAGPSAYTSEALDGEPQRLMVGHGSFAGIPLSWLERGEWMEAQFLLGERRYLTGPLKCAGFRVDVGAHERGTLLRLRSYIRPAQPFPDELAAAIVNNLERAADSYSAALQQLFSGAEVPEQVSGEPAASYGKRALMGLTPNELLDRVEPVNQDDFEACARRLAELPIDPEHRERMLELVRTRSDLELEQIRPFALARSWGLRRRPLLRSFLHASTAGLFDMHWQLTCPHCRVGAGAVDRLAAITREAHCLMCDDDFEVDVAANVEAVFRPNPAIRPIRDRIYCASSPWFRPHVFACVELEPHQTRRLAVPLAEGGFVARTLVGRRAVNVDASSARIVLGQAGLEAELLGETGGDIELVNTTDRQVTVLLERRDSHANATHGTDIITMPEFLDLYGTEAPASGVDLTIGRVVVLFSDLTNTTSAYQSLGDARAFSLVQEHFHDMAEIVANHDGAVLKTMGDAVMASFVRAGDAVAAALAMMEATRKRHGIHGFHLKIGVHDGPCVMVRANQRMDLFGTTVNIASRLQEQACADQLVVLSSLLEMTEVGSVLAEHKLRPVTVKKQLKGLSDDHSLAVITLPPVPATVENP